MASLQSEKQPPSTAHPQPHPRGVLWHRLFRSFIYLIAWIFLVLALVGNVADKPVLRDTWFLKLDLSKIMPTSVPNATLINSIAQSIGLHDFYQVGLWNFCEGYEDTGITHCSTPEPLYWFDPVSIILSELLAGASVALPSDISSALRIARIASHWMFVLFLIGAILSFLAIFIVPFAVSSRPPQDLTADPDVNAAVHYHHRPTFILLRSLPLLIFTFLAAFATTVASAVATVMFIIFRNVFVNNAVDLNIQATLGIQILVFVWIASAFTLLGFIIQIGSCCAACCGGRKARKELRRNTATSGRISRLSGSTAPAGGLYHDEENADAPGAGIDSSDSSTLVNTSKRRFRWRKTRVEA